jgi:hypothetical protein
MKIYDSNDQIASADDLKDAFAAYERDNYPLGLYAALLDYLQEIVEEDVYELDVVGLDCDIQAAIGLDEIADIIGKEEEELEVMDWEDIVDYAAAQVDYFLFADEASKAIYFF